ncbi:MAG: molybdenum cofactor guanylyltransferase [Rhodanobacter sp.]|jgi:molybdenum cofactor guanylyltransferase|nr:molybdenum cofactor guanylyltransferase [Rhodanobacter sp.]
MESAITIAILAGGAAARLGGRDKGLELLGGRPLVAWVVAALPRDAQWLIVANRHIDVYGAYAPTVSDAIAGYAGPLAGIAAALAACGTPYLATLPVDCPAPPANLVPRLLDALRARAVDACVVHDGERRQPLFALYRRELAVSAAAAATRCGSVGEWQGAIGAIELDFADQRRQFRNLNTAEDFIAYADEHGLVH